MHLGRTATRHDAVPFAEDCLVYPQIGWTNHSMGQIKPTEKRTFLVFVHAFFYQGTPFLGYSVLDPPETRGWCGFTILSELER